MVHWEIVLYKTYRQCLVESEEIIQFMLAWDMHETSWVIGTKLKQTWNGKLYRNEHVHDFMRECGEREHLHAYMCALASSQALPAFQCPVCDIEITERAWGWGYVHTALINTQWNHRNYASSLQRCCGLVVTCVHVFWCGCKSPSTKLAKGSLCS